MSSFQVDGCEFESHLSLIYSNVTKLVKVNDWKSFNVGSIPTVTTKKFIQYRVVAQLVALIKLEILL
jgi:hypothetical protein